MSQAPKWYLPVAILALLWNAAGCVAYLHDVMLTPQDIAGLPAAQQALYAARPAWAIAAMAIAVWCGAAGCVGLILRRNWSKPLFTASLAGLAVQDFGLFAIAGVARVEPSAVVIQGLVLLIAVALLLLARRAAALGWNR
jgi:hypothetical protein